MKTSKLTAILLTALLTLPLLAGCADPGGTASADPENEVTTADPYAPPSTQAPDYSAATGMLITVVANGMDMGNAFSATVCEPYRDVLGKTVNIDMGGQKDLHVCSGDEFRVKVDRVDATTPPTVYAAEIELVAYGKYHEGDEEFMIPGYGYGPYTIPELSQITVIETMPSAEQLKDKSYPYDLRKYDWSDYGALRVIKVEDGIVYLSEVFHGKASVALVGIPDADFRVGDHVNIDVTRYYQTEEDRIKVAYIEDVTVFTLLTDEEVHSAYASACMIEKPVIYLYPEEETICSVKVDLDGTLTCTYPDHGAEGWQNFTAKPDGTLIFPDGSEYYCLYWEGLAQLEPDFSKGFCVKGSDTADFLAKVLPEIGLTAREANEFIIYWLPILQKNPYNLISFQGEAYTSVAGLEIAPAPDSLLRVYMAAKPLTAPIEIEPQTFDGFERNGFTVVEWGGSVIEE